MPPVAENRPTDQPKANVATEDAATRPAGTPASRAALVSGAGATPALVVRESQTGETEAEEDLRDTRLDRLPMQLDVTVKVQSFRVRDLLAMEAGTVLETIHEHTQDVPVRSGGALLVWAEFEVLDQQLAVRVTRLA